MCVIRARAVKSSLNSIPKADASSALYAPCSFSCGAGVVDQVEPGCFTILCYSTMLHYTTILYCTTILATGACGGDRQAPPGQFTMSSSTTLLYFTILLYYVDTLLLLRFIFGVVPVMEAKRLHQGCRRGRAVLQYLYYNFFLYCDYIL